MAKNYIKSTNSNGWQVMLFSAHGNIDDSVLGRCVINRPNAPFNAKGIEALFDNILQTVEELGLKDWVLVESIGTEALLTPAAANTLADQYIRCKNLGCARICAACSLVIQESFLTKVAKQAGIDMHFFSEENEALKNLQEFLS